MHGTVVLIRSYDSMRVRQSEKPTKVLLSFPRLVSPTTASVPPSSSARSRSRGRISSTSSRASAETATPSARTSVARNGRYL